MQRCPSVPFKLGMVESSKAMKKKEFREGGINKTTANNMGLVKQYFGADGVVVGGSWFAPVSTASALLEEGLPFMGIMHNQYRTLFGRE